MYFFYSGLSVHHILCWHSDHYGFPGCRARCHSWKRKPRPSKFPGLCSFPLIAWSHHLLPSPSSTSPLLSLLLFLATLATWLFTASQQQATILTLPLDLQWHRASWRAPKPTRLHAVGLLYCQSNQSWSGLEEWMNSRDTSLLGGVLRWQFPGWLQLCLFCFCHFPLLFDTGGENRVRFCALLVGLYILFSVFANGDAYNLNILFCLFIFFRNVFVIILWCNDTVFLVFNSFISLCTQNYESVLIQESFHLTV